MTNIERLTKAQLIEEISKLTSRESRIVNNYEEEMKNRTYLNERRMRRVRNELDYVLPTTTDLSKYDLFYWKDDSMDYREFAIAKKDVMKIDKYEINRQIYALPEEFKLKNIRCCLLAIFDTSHKLIRYGITTNRMNNLITFHSTQGDVCLGGNGKARSVVDYGNTKTIVEGFEEVKATLETINPASLLTAPEDYDTKFFKTYEFVKAKFDEHRRANSPTEEGTCRFCHELYDTCGCDVCVECNELTDNCRCIFAE